MATPMPVPMIPARAGRVASAVPMPDTISPILALIPDMPGPIPPSSPAPRDAPPLLPALPIRVWKSLSMPAMCEVNRDANDAPDLSPVSPESAMARALLAGSTFSLIVSVVSMFPGADPVTSRLIVSVVVMLPGCWPVSRSLTAFVVLVLPAVLALPVAPAAPTGPPPPCWVTILPSSPDCAACCALGAPVTGCGLNSEFSAPSTLPWGLDFRRCAASRLSMLSKSAKILRALPRDADSNTAEIRIL